MSALEGALALVGSWVLESPITPSVEVESSASDSSGSPSIVEVAVATGFSSIVEGAVATGFSSVVEGAVGAGILL